MDVENLAKELILKNMTPEQQMAVLDSVRQSVTQAKEVQKRKIGENVDLVVQALKKIESDIRSRFDDVGFAIEKRVASIKDGRDGTNGKDGRDGKDGKNGRDGAKGDRGDAGQNGRDGVDGVDGVSVTSARIDFDGSLIIALSSGVELNVGEVVAPDLAERIKVITNGGGTSQSVLDTLASLQTQINNLIPSQTGNAGKFLTTNGTALSWATGGGGLAYQGTWNASTNTPTLASSTGTNGYYYIVATAGSTNLNGITDWQVGDWLLFNGTVWQKIDQSETLQFVTSADSSVTVTTTGSTADLAVYTAPRLISQVRNETGATLTKGTVVYISGASGNKATVSKAICTSDATSAQTFGLIFADIANNQNGYAILSGDLAGLDTSAFAAGTQLYLSSTTAGSYTSTKQYAPNHLVYIGVVTRSHATQGSIEVRIQNGYEMDELHNVSAQNPSNGQVLIYNASTSLWEKNTLTDGAGISITEGAGSITIANSGVLSAIAGTGISVSGATGNVTITNSAPDQTVVLTGAGTTSITGTYPNFTITSNDAYSGTVTSVTGTSPVASSGGNSPAISLASGYGDTQNPYASKTANYVLAAPNGTAGVPTFRAIVAADIPTLNQNTTGSAATVTTTISSGAVATTQTAGDNSTKVATTAYVNTITGTSGITGFKNRIINGAMVIDQRNAGASVTPANNGYSLDRWKYYSTQASKVSIQQNAGSVTPPSGFKNYLGVTSLSAYSVLSTDYFAITQGIEGFNIADFGYGASGASTVTLSFWVRSSLTGTFGGSITNDAANYAYPFTYTISAANTWEQKSITITGATSGTWLSTNGAGIQLIFGLGAGSTYSGTAGSWAGANYVSATGATSVVGTNGATWYVTGVQLEKGSTATSFDYRPYGTELALCQRYYEKSFAIDTAPANGVYSMGYIGYVCYADQWVFAAPTILFKVTKRATPTITYYGTSSNKWQINDNSNNWIDYAAIGQFQATIGTYTTGFSTGVHNNGNSGYAIGSARMIRGDWVASSEL